jgi:hypothetical protein
MPRDGIVISYDSPIFYFFVAYAALHGGLLIYIPNDIMSIFNFAFPPAIIVACPFHHSHFNGYEVISPYGTDFHFPYD